MGNLNVIQQFLTVIGRLTDPPSHRPVNGNPASNPSKTDAAQPKMATNGKIRAPSARQAASFAGTTGWYCCQIPGVGFPQASSTGTASVDARLRISRRA